MGAATKIKWKRTVNQLRYLYEEHDLIKRMATEAGPHYQQYYEEYCRRNGIDISALTTSNQDRIDELYGSNDESESLEEEDEQDPTDIPDRSLVVRDKEMADVEEDKEYKMSQEEQELHDTFRKVFLKLALQLHPDKIDYFLPENEIEEKKKTFQIVKDAFEKRKYFILLDYAEKYDITVPKNYQQQVKWMKQEIFNLEKEIEREKITYSYSFAECDTDEQRDRLIERFLRQVFGEDFAKTS